ncbi:hypothetical protein ACJ73_08347 [Blastomyces percursus]|uniref:EKC/KEOPS complex subunit BUD32 n=1 Tax=Blastomyces percursus TaxID=1658174 RepID=A0A1J9QYC3_9EURO|nr:hypothetical protein ACJ73_08347 [Blastomyces percursus]
MASLSEDDHKVIKDHPLDDSLDKLRRSLLDVERSYSVVSSFDGPDDKSELCQKAVSQLLSAFIETDAAFILRSRISSGNVASEIGLLRVRVRKGDFSFTHYRPLVKLVIQKASDYNIWTAVLDLITTLSRTKQLIDATVFEEIRGCTYRDVRGFYKKYFEGKSWTDRARDVYESVKDRRVGGKWVGLRDSPAQKEVHDWLFQVQDDFLSKERRHYYTINLPIELTGGEARRRVDLLVKRKRGNPSDTEHDWRDIEVIGELKASNNRGVKEPLVQLARYARDVFACQPTRRYLHAFTICGLVMTAWVFDRSGCYSPGPFNIHLEPERFIRLIAGYSMMDEEELGLDTFTERDGERRFIRVKQDGTEMKLQLEPQPLTRQRAIICRGTSCFLTKAPDSEDWNHVTKFSWTSDKRKPEADILELANKRGVEGIAKLVGHRSITNIKEMRSDMTFSKPYSRWDTSSAASSFSQPATQSFQSRPPSALSSFSELHGLTIEESTGQRTSRKRKSVDAGTNPKKRSRSNSHRSTPPQNEVTYDVEEAQGASLLAPSNGPYDKRILRCLVIYPAGRPIHKYQSSLELLEALRDAIKALRSLHSKGKILHRDVSENNIIITDPKKTGRAGMLIDLDLAKELGTRRSGARCRTGTMEFMAIEVLLNKDHTYRHDLESFFYVLIWQCARRDWEFVRNPGGRPKPSLLTEWYTGSYEKIATAKGGVVENANRFELILGKEFPPEFDSLKPICRELRQILFPWGGDAVFTGTPKDPEVLYGPILKAFDKGIDDIKEGE